MKQIDAKVKAQILVEALPYIQQYVGKIIVIKYGGNAMINEELKEAVIKDVVLLNLIGDQRDAGEGRQGKRISQRAALYR